jgi:hypothetical protein
VFIRTSRPPQSKGAKGVNVHLRIDARRVLIVMTQNLADLREGGSGTQQLCGQAEQVSALVRSTTNSGAHQRRLGEL